MDYKKANEAVTQMFRDIKTTYDNKPAKGKVNILVTGDYGIGKTSLAATAVKPVLIDSYDPGGTKTASLQPYIKNGDILVDDSYEHDSWKQPNAHRLWESNFEKRKRSGFFDHLGTYFIDSGTRWALSYMYFILQTGGIMGGKKVVSGMGSTPQQQDYLFQQLGGGGLLGQVMDLPCNVVITFHPTKNKNEITGMMETSLMVWGKFAEQIPLLFDEKYYMKINGTGSSATHVLQVKHDGIYRAETRIGGEKYATFMPPDLKNLLKIAGKPYEDKPKIF